MFGQMYAPLPPPRPDAPADEWVRWHLEKMRRQDCQARVEAVAIGVMVLAVLASALLLIRLVH